MSWDSRSVLKHDYTQSKLTMLKSLISFHPPEVCCMNNCHFSKQPSAHGEIIIL